MNKNISRILQEARADKERFVAWGGEELFSRFNKYKTRLEQPKNDMTYWTSTQNPHTPDELSALIKEFEDAAEKKEKAKKLAKEGAELIFEDETWIVYHIKTFEASAKYGAGSKWCIAGKNMAGEDSYGNRYWDSYTRDGKKFYFFLKKGSTEKYALVLHGEGIESFTIFNVQDRAINAIPGGPIVPGLPDVAQGLEQPEEEVEDDDVEDVDFDPIEAEEEGEEAELVPPPYVLEPVQNPRAMQFRAASLEAALERFNNAELVSDVSDNLFVIKMGEGRYTLFVFNGAEAGPLMTQQGQNSFALVIFSSPETLNVWVQQNRQNLQIQETEGPGEANESFSETKHDEPINTLQSMIDNAKLDHIVVYQDGDNQVLPTNPELLDKNGNVVVKDGLILVDYENTEDGEIIARGAQEVADTLKDWEVLGELNGSTEMIDQVCSWLKDKFGVSVGVGLEEGVLLLFNPNKSKEAYIDDEPEPIIFESTSGFSPLHFFK